jgi:hypothetical protein
VKIFISYRRQDCPKIVDRIAGHLRQELGDDQVFKDVDSLDVGENFFEKIQAALTAADVLLVVIGPGWLGATSEVGRRRIDDPDDWVRIEVHAALHREDVRVVPLLVEGAAMPGEGDLPPGLKRLAYRNARWLRPDPLFEDDLGLLVGRLASEPHVAAKHPSQPDVSVSSIQSIGRRMKQACQRVLGNDNRQAIVYLGMAGMALVMVALLAVILMKLSRIDPLPNPIPTPPGLAPFRKFQVGSIYYAWDRIPEPAAKQLEVMSRVGVVAFAAAPSGGWVVVAKDGRIAFEGTPPGYDGELRDCIRQKHRILNIAFSFAGGWTILTDQAHRNSNDGLPKGCLQRQKELVAVGGKLLGVAYGLEDAWVITSDRSGVFTSISGGDFEDRVRSFTAAGPIRIVALSPEGRGSILIDGRRYDSRFIPPECFKAIEEATIGKMSINNVTLTRAGGWAVIASAP